MKRYLMWLSLFFVIGVLTFCPLAEKSVIYTSITFGVIFIIICLFKRQFALPLLLCLAFVLGMQTIRTDSKNNNMYSPFDDGNRIICGKVLDSYKSDEYAVSIIKTESVDYKNIQGRVKLYVENGSLLDYGDSVYVVCSVEPVTKPKRKNEVDYRAYNYSRGIYANCFAKDGTVRVTDKDESFSLGRLGTVARRKIKESISKMYPTEEAGILTALMLGDKSGVSDDFKDIGSRVGIYHTMATSGLHVSVLLTFFGLLIGKINKRKIAAVLNIVLLGLIFVVIGYSPSISRAVVMAILTCIAQITDSKSDSYTSLALSAVVILAFRPYALFDAGFLLSFASTLGIVIIYQKFSGKVKIKALSLLLISVAALLGTGALTVFYFGRLTLLGTFANILIVPVAEFILPLGYISVIMAMIWFPVGDFLSYAVYPLLKIYVFIAELFSKVPFASVEVSKPSAFATFIITAAILGLFAIIPVKGDIYEGRTTKEKSAK